jgi:hypothetical protein
VQSGRYVWHFLDDAGKSHAITAGVAGIHLEIADQIATFAAPLPVGRFRVEAIGDGPEHLRFTPWFAI